MTPCSEIPTLSTRRGTTHRSPSSSSHSASVESGACCMIPRLPVGTEKPNVAE